MTAELAGDAAEFAGVRALLIRPDGYIAWATAADDPPPLARWLGKARRAGTARTPEPAFPSSARQYARTSRLPATISDARRPARGQLNLTTKCPILYP